MKIDDVLSLFVYHKILANRKFGENLNDLWMTSNRELNKYFYEGIDNGSEEW